MHHPTDRITHTTPLLHQSWSTGWNERFLGVDDVDGVEDNLIKINSTNSTYEHTSAQFLFVFKSLSGFMQRRFE